MLLERCVSSQREVVELLAVVYYMLAIQNWWVIRWCSYTLVCIYMCIIVKLHCTLLGILVYELHDLLINEQIKMCSFSKSS